MTDVNIFVDKYAYLQISSNFEDIKRVYYENEKNIEKYLEERNRIDQEEKWDFNFKRQVDLYNFLKYCVDVNLDINFYDLTSQYKDISHAQYINIPRNGNDYFLYYTNLLLYLDVNYVYNLKKEDYSKLLIMFEDKFPDVPRYFDLCQKIIECNNIEEKVLYSIHFDEGDILVNIAGKLINLIKNEEYELNTEDTEFLTWCAKEKGLLVENVTKEDIPFIKECIDLFNKEKEGHGPKYRKDDADSWYDWKDVYLAYEETGALFNYINEELEKRENQKKIKFKK